MLCDSASRSHVLVIRRESPSKTFIDAHRAECYNPFEELTAEVSTARACQARSGSFMLRRHSGQNAVARL
jgi:hypothetical protein